jgi:hypothetical protein
MNDIIVEEVRRIREELIERHSGIDGYFKYCQAQDRAWQGAAKLDLTRSGLALLGRTARGSDQLESVEPAHTLLSFFLRAPAMSCVDLGGTSA